MRLDGVSPYPIELWNWGMQHRIDGLKPGNAEELRRHLLPRADGAITAQGLSFQGRHYMPADPTLHESALRRVTEARVSGSEKVEVSYHPASLEDVYLSSPDDPNGPLVSWSLIREPDAVMRHLSWFDWEELRNEDVVASDVSRTDDDQAQADLMQVEETIIQGAKVRLAEARNGRSRSSRVKDVAVHRKVETERLLQDRLHRDKGDVAPAAADVVADDALVVATPPRTIEFRPRERHTGPPGLIEMLRKRPRSEGAQWRR